MQKTITRNKKILVVDDDLAILDALTIMLEDEGYEVEVSHDGKTEARVEKFAPDLILLDIWMSGVDGRTICKALKAKKTTKHIPIILVSANKDAKKISQDVGANGYLSKPFEMKELFSIITEHTAP